MLRDESNSNEKNGNEDFHAEIILVAKTET